MNTRPGPTDPTSTGQRPPRTALVTGGGRGIGVAIVERLATSGMKVVVADLRHDEAVAVAESVKAAGGRALAVETDVTDSASVDAAVARAEEVYGPVEVLVNCAGWDDLQLFVDTDEDYWDRVIDINYKGVLRTVRRTLPAMNRAGWGRIVNVGSDAGRVGSSFEAVYSGAKGGVASFTKTIARESARHGVTANTVCPGPTDTPLVQESIARRGDKVVNAMVRAVPMRRLATTAEVAEAVGFFASEGAGFVTGQTLSVSGGLVMS
ncbi:SDR family NAD(P)-dependent oxidoreductase [Nocardioides acrostichi]|uniref:SDR family oxidoreductase n=1 Tax=Nocardioides acrostichi TaxID=2784339 RepID=A0A930V059_9ACTN|nr:SDR family NAD(P)-dependent oxidoreductase [Nocardioides acrostichi]MBF4160804.1 SDR family oxidoreductase [Nocardioides acrostichi]